MHGTHACAEGASFGDAESTSRIPAALVREIIDAEHAPTNQVPTEVVRSVLAKHGIRLRAAHPEVRAVVPPPRRARARIAAPNDVGFDAACDDVFGDVVFEDVVLDVPASDEDRSRAELARAALSVLDARER